MLLQVHLKCDSSAVSGFAVVMVCTKFVVQLIRLSGIKKVQKIRLFIFYFFSFTTKSQEITKQLLVCLKLNVTYVELHC